MELNIFDVKHTCLTPFGIYLLENPKVKQLCKEFDFYNICFYKEELDLDGKIYLRYPKNNLYWYLDFKKYIEKHIYIKGEFIEEWVNLLVNLKSEIKNTFNTFTFNLSHINTADIVTTKIKYQLRDYQACDLLTFIQKYKNLNQRGLILSEPRTGKSRVALAACLELLHPGDLVLIISPKSAEPGWKKEVELYPEDFKINVIQKISDIKLLTTDVDKINVRIISYDLFKHFTVSQIRQLSSKNKHIILIGDEIHRLRNFKTEQSKAIFAFKEFCQKDHVDLGIIGLTGTPAVKESSDVFGILSLINESKIRFKPFYDSFNCFKEYFYYCEDTSFGKITKALKREHELNFLIQMCSVQTKQRELEIFKYYKKEYLKIDLDMDKKQKEIYDSVYENMEYDEDIDCQNKLVQLVRLQQICVDPSDLVATYATISPKLKWVIGFAKKNPIKFIVASKKTKPLKHLMSLLDSEGITYSSIIGEYDYKRRVLELNNFKDPAIQIMLLQLDTGKEALTLPMAKAIIFLDRDFAQGFNEQAEARMTPIDGSHTTKYVIDLVMKNSKEEQIYQTLVVKKKSIDAINLVFKSKKGGD